MYPQANPYYPQPPLPVQQDPKYSTVSLNLVSAWLIFIPPPLQASFYKQVVVELLEQVSGHFADELGEEVGAEALGQLKKVGLRWV
jgi:hypothetical protein